VPGRIGENSYARDNRYCRGRRRVRRARRVRLEPVDGAPATVGPSFPDLVALTPSGTITGVVHIPNRSDDKITTIEFSAELSQGGDVGKWTVG
jgi:hypothetical protein